MAKPNPNSPLTMALRLGAVPFAFAGLFSLVTNLLYLALPLYTTLVYQRVLTSYSQATLFVLTFGVLAVFVVSGVLDHLRSRILNNYRRLIDERTSSELVKVLF